MSCTCSGAPPSSRRALLGAALGAASIPFLPFPVLAEGSSIPKDVYGTSVTLRGETLPLSTFKNKVLVVVNVASE